MHTQIYVCAFMCFTTFMYTCYLLRLYCKFVAWQACWLTARLYCCTVGWRSFSARRNGMPKSLRTSAQVLLPITSLLFRLSFVVIVWRLASVAAPQVSQVHPWRLCCQSLLHFVFCARTFARQVLLRALYIHHCCHIHQCRLSLSVVSAGFLCSIRCHIHPCCTSLLTVEVDQATHHVLHRTNPCASRNGRHSSGGTPGDLREAPAPMA